jgi:hypothetical protein
MKPEGSLPCSQQLVTGPYPEADKCNPHPPPRFPKIRSNNYLVEVDIDGKTILKWILEAVNVWIVLG